MAERPIHPLARAAFTGLLLAAGSCKEPRQSGAASASAAPVAAAPPPSAVVSARPVAIASADAAGRDCCMGKNPCKGRGGCAVPESHACNGRNECRGQGGCAGWCPR